MLDGVRLPKEELRDRPLDNREVAEDPQRMIAAARGRLRQRRVAHVLGGPEHPLVGLPQRPADQVDRLHFVSPFFRLPAIPPAISAIRFKRWSQPWPTLSRTSSGIVPIAWCVSFSRVPSPSAVSRYWRWLTPGYDM